MNYFLGAAAKSWGWGDSTQGSHAKCTIVPHTRGSGGSKFIGKSSFKILICGGASSCYSLAISPLNLLLVSDVGFLEGQDS